MPAKVDKTMNAGAVGGRWRHKWRNIASSLIDVGLGKSAALHGVMS